MARMKAYERMMRAAQALDKMDRDSGLEPWNEYMRCYYEWCAS